MLEFIPNKTALMHKEQEIEEHFQKKMADIAQDAANFLKDVHESSSKLLKGDTGYDISIIFPYSASLQCNCIT